MCQSCGCQPDGLSDHPDPLFPVPDLIVPIEKHVFAQNNQIAAQMAKQLLEQKILALNIMGAPGSGKTSVIEQLAPRLSSANIGVIQGDIASNIDQERLMQQGIDTYQINTHSGCHLNAAMIQHALSHLSLQNRRYLFIENVGNLVCPAGVAIGQHVNILVSSVTEGSDKPRKYPTMFRDASLIIITKHDLADAVDFDAQRYRQDLLKINPQAIIFSTSTREPGTFSEVSAHIAKLYTDWTA